jgi:hypothetical protein
MDYNYHKTAKSINNTVNETQRGDRISFPIEKARSKSSCVLVSCLAVCIVGYGWAIRARVVSFRTWRPSSANVSDAIAAYIYPSYSNLFTRLPSILFNSGKQELTVSRSI